MCIRDSNYMAEKKLEGAGLRGQVAGKTSLSTVGKAGKGLTLEDTKLKYWQKRPLLKKLPICFSMEIYQIKRNLIPTLKN